MVAIVLAVLMVIAGVYALVVGPNAVGYYVAFGSFALSNVLYLATKLLERGRWRR